MPPFARGPESQPTRVSIPQGVAPGEAKADATEAAVS